MMPYTIKQDTAIKVILCANMHSVLGYCLSYSKLKASQVSATSSPQRVPAQVLLCMFLYLIIMSAYSLQKSRCTSQNKVNACDKGSVCMLIFICACI